MRFRETNGSRPRPVRPQVHPTNTLRDCTAPCELIAPSPGFLLGLTSLTFAMWLHSASHREVCFCTP